VPCSTLPEESVDSAVLPPYNLIIFNDDHHTFEFVVAILMKVFRKPVEESFRHALETHETGRSIVWSGSKELGELKLDQLTTFHEGEKGPMSAALEPG